MKKRIGYKKVVLLGFVLVLALCFGLAGAVHAKTEKKADKKEILIGTNLPLTGILSMVGIEQKRAYERAVADINKAGGVMVKVAGHRRVRANLAAGGAARAKALAVKQCPVFQSQNRLHLRIQKSGDARGQPRPLQALR